MFTPFHQAAFKSFMTTVKSQNWDYHVVIKNRQTGDIVSCGNSDMAEKYLSEKSAKERRESGDWVPNKPISKMPVQLSRLMADTDLVRKYASKVITELLGPKQGLGTVSNQWIIGGWGGGHYHPPVILKTLTMTRLIMSDI